MHWTEQSANLARQQLGLKSFVTRADAERLLDYALSQGVEVQWESEADCLAEIRPVASRRARWRLKLSTALEESLRADVIVHELGHLYTRSGMTSFCPRWESWWWHARDENDAMRWSAHFRLPTTPFQALLRKAPSWEDLRAECQAPDALIALKLRLLGHQYLEQIRSVLASPGLEIPAIASHVLQVRIQALGESSHQLEVINRYNGQRWVAQKSMTERSLLACCEELSWDLAAWSETRFWSRWLSRLDPVSNDHTPNID